MTASCDDQIKVMKQEIRLLAASTALALKILESRFIEEDLRSLLLEGIELIESVAKKNSEE